MQKMIRAWFKYLIFAGIFGCCVNLIYLALPVYIMVVYDRVLFSFTRVSLYALGAGVLLCLIFMAVLDYLKQKMMALAGRDLGVRMRSGVIAGMFQGTDYDRGLRDLEILRTGVVEGKLIYVLDLPWIGLYLWGLVIIHPLIGAVAGGAVFISLVAQILLRLLENRQYTLADVARYANESRIKNFLSGRRLIKGMGMLPAVQERFEKQDQKVAHAADKGQGAHAFIGSLTGIIHLIGLAGVFTAGAYVFFSDQITGGAIFASVLMAVRLFYPFQHSLDNMRAAIEAQGAYRRLKAFVKIDQAKSQFSLPDPKGSLSVEQAGLTINGKSVLTNISVDLAPGEFLGVLGPACAGKTSLCRMILGILPMARGKVCLDGAEIGLWPKKELGSYVGYVSQEPVLFEVSVAENIARLGQVDPDKVIRAAKKAGIHEMVLKLPNGYDTKIEQNGTNLAASQKQLLCLARAVYGDPKLVVMDEPHTFLDENGFKLLVGCLNQLKQEKTTVVMVTDKTNLLAGSDKILVVKEGQAAMYGPAGDVLARLQGQQPQQTAGV